MAGKTNYEKIKREALARQQKGEMDDRWWKPEMGRHRIRILPPPDNFDSWYLSYGVHYGITGDDDAFQTVTCPKLTLQKRCYVCEFVKGLWQKKTTADTDIARRMNHRTRYISNILVLSSKNPNEVKLWSYGKQVMEQLEAAFVDADGNVFPIDDPQKGLNFKVTITMENTPQGNYPKYIVTPEPSACPLPDKNVLNKLHNFVEIIHSRVRPYEEIKAMMLGGGPNAPVVKDEAVTGTVAPETAEAAVGEEEVIEDVKENENASTETSGAAPEELVRKAREALARRVSGSK